MSRILSVAALVGATGCDISTASEDREPIGLVILDSRGDVVVDTELPADVLQVLEVTIDATETFTIRVLADDRDTFEIDGEEFAVDVSVSAEAASLAAIEQEGSDRLVITGRQDGWSQMSVTLHHEGRPELDRNVNFMVYSPVDPGAGA